MKVRFEREALLAQIKPLDRMIGTERRNLREEFVRLEARDAEVVWEGSGEESEARRRHPLDGVTIEREGCIDVRARLLVEIAERTPKEGWVSIEREGAGEGKPRASGICADTLIRCHGPGKRWKGARFVVNRLVEEREPFDAGRTRDWATLKGKTLKAMLSACETDAKGNRTSGKLGYFREGVRIERIEGTLRCTSTDTVDITWSETGKVRFHTPAQGEGEEQWTLRATNASELRDLLPDGEEEITIVYEESEGENAGVKNLGIRGASTQWKTAAIALKYPPAGALISRIKAARPAAHATVERLNLRRAARMAKIGGGEVEMEGTGEGLEVRSVGVDKTRDVVSCKERGGSIPSIAISGQRLAEIGEILDGDDVTLSYVETPRKVLIAREAEPDKAGLGAVTHWLGSVTSPGER